MAGSSRGPTKKPTRFKVLEGNPGNRPLDPDPPRLPPRTRIPTPPRNMGKHGRREWRRVAKVLIALGVLTDLDMTLFTAYCHLYHEYYDAQLQVTKLGTILISQRSGGAYQNPYVAIKRQALRDMKDLSAKFGLSPPDRARVLSGLESPEDDVDALGRWLFVNQPRSAG